TLLERMGYGYTGSSGTATKTAFNADLAKRLRQFQSVNGLNINGELDNHTLNRLMDFNFQVKNLRRAKVYDAAHIAAEVDKPDQAGAPACPGGYFKIVNPDADHYDDENITPIRKAGFPKYPYYIAGALLPPGGGPAQVPATGGWIRELGTGNTVQG